MIPDFDENIATCSIIHIPNSRQRTIMSHNQTLVLNMFNFSDVTCNETAVNPDQPHCWDYSSILSLIITTAGIITNGTALLVFIKNRNTLITPFNVYLINLLLANLSNLLLFYPLDIFHQVNGNSWWLGNSICTLYLYGFFVLNGSMGNSHLLIILNRLWAITFPMSYRNFHSRSLAIKICVGMWIYLHACLLPGVVLDALYYRPPLETAGCQFNVTAQFDWGESTQILNFDVPLILIALNYFFIVYKTAKRKSSKLIRNGRVHPAVKHSDEDEGSLIGRQGTKMEVFSIFPRNLTEGATVEITNETHQQRAPQLSRLASQMKKVKRRRQNSPFCGQRFLVLTLMTTCVLLFHTPQQVYVTWWFLTQIDIPSVLAPFNLMLALPSVMDPVLFTITLTDVRKAVVQFLHCSS